jgi:hypothetical protein
VDEALVLMTTYADPTRCPDCHAALLQDPQVCRRCSLPLTGETAVSLFTTLQEADRLLGVLRAQKRSAPVTVGAPAVAGSLLEGVERYPAPGPGAAEALDAAPRLRAASVPKILLSLGALCLLVAAVIFLAVAWRWLDVGGRTSVLIVLTGTALGSALALNRRDLRMAAESVCVVGLGLLAMDVVGIDRAGWLGQGGDGPLAFLPGAVVGTGALLMLLLTWGRPLVAPGVIAPVATLAAGLGAVWDVEATLPMLVTCVVLLALGRVGTEVRLRSMVVLSLVTMGLGSLYVLSAGFDAVTENAQDVAHVWGDAAAWPLVAATVLVAASGPVVGLHRTATSVFLGVAGLLGSYVALTAALDNGQTPALTSVTVLAGAWAAALAVAPARQRLAIAIPLAGTVVVPVYVVLVLLISSVSAVLTVGDPFTRPYDVRVASVYTEPSRWLLAPSLFVIALTGCAIVAWFFQLGRRAWIAVLSSAVVVGAVATLPLFDVPLAAVVGAILALAALALVAAERLVGTSAVACRVTALALTAAAVLGALPSDRMTTAALLVGCVMAGYLLVRRDVTGAVAALCFPIAFAGLVWAGGNVAGIDEQFRAIPVLLVLGTLAIWRPRVEHEASSVVVGTLVSAASIALAQDLNASLAVHLTVAGALVTATSLVHPSRRLLAWPGGLLLAAATWVRLYDLGVHVPEAYTLPAALVLLAVGGWRLRQDDRSATLTYLAPGLALATEPSLFAMLDDPASLRALLLGIACLGLVLAGVAFRWSAPLVIGAATGTLLVLRELAPYAPLVPTWLTIGISGAVLLGVGITWENRMRDVHRSTRYVAALR